MTKKLGRNIIFELMAYHDELSPLVPAFEAQTAPRA
jgi:hypothetical protein